MTTTTAAGATPPPVRKLPPVLGRLLSGSFWLALRAPLQAVFALWTIPLILQAIGPRMMDAYLFAWGFGFFQMLFELGMSSALQRQVAESYTKGDRAGVDRAIACGMNFYAAMALVQVAAILGVMAYVIPSSFQGASHQLIIKLLWLQALTAPFYGLSAVVSSVLQAARRYDFQPRFELAVIILRFVVLLLGVNAGFDFFWIIVTQTAVQIVLALGPALWVMIFEIGHSPRFRGAGRDDYRALMHISFYVFMIQLSVVLADKLDVLILGYAIRPASDGAISVYNVVSKPFMQIRQTGWALTYMVMPAVASLIAASDERSLNRLKYDGSRLHIAAIFPVALLAWLYAGPFLTLWVGNKLGHDAGVHADLLRLFLVAAVPLVLSVTAQMTIGMNKPKWIAIAALVGAMVNLPLSYYLTRWLGVAGVIWGTVLTTLFSNLLIPGVYIFRVLKIQPARFLSRTLSAPLCGGLALVVTALAMQAAFPLHPSPLGGMSLLRWLPLAAHLAVGCLAYLAGYLATPVGRADLVEIVGKLRRR